MSRYYPTSNHVGLIANFFTGVGLNFLNCAEVGGLSGCGRFGWIHSMTDDCDLEFVENWQGLLIMILSWYYKHRGGSINLHNCGKSGFQAGETCSLGDRVTLLDSDGNWEWWWWMRVNEDRFAVKGFWQRPKLENHANVPKWCTWKSWIFWSMSSSSKDKDSRFKSRLFQCSNPFFLSRMVLICWEDMSIWLKLRCF